MGSNTEKKSWTNLQNLHKNWSKENKSDNFCYWKVGRAITKWGAKVSRILKNIDFDNIPKSIFNFGGTNNNFIDCTFQIIIIFHYSIINRVNYTFIHFIALSIVIALSTIATAIVVALSCKIFFISFSKRL